MVCSLPSNVFLLTGYWPVVGTSIAICVPGGPTWLLVPEDEQELAATSFADAVQTFVPETLTCIRSISDALKPRLAEALGKLNVRAGRVGVDSGASSQAASYLALYLFGDSLPHLLRELMPAVDLISINEWIDNLGSVKTEAELERIRQACAIAKNAYELGVSQLRAGMKEPEAAQLFRAPLSTAEVAGRPIHRRDGFAFCMSGPNSAKAYAAYARTRWRTLESTDLVMIHCNSYVDGYWADITRTFTLQPPNRRQEDMYSAVLAARQAALSVIRPGARAAAVDAAARQAIQDFGLGPYLKHGTGHGVGFSPMSAYSLPRIHAASSDVLQPGMIFNVEPAVYIEGYGGVRHCDMVAVTGTGNELLTPFQANMESLTALQGYSVRGHPIQSAV